MRAQPHPDQGPRLAALRSLDILDTPREAVFDDFVKLASTICEKPISVVNFIDEHRQWFKAEVGLGVRETPLETSICSHVILEQDFVEIEDTLTDPRTADNELCLSADGLRFYAGALLRPGGGLPVGTLCVLDTKPGKLSESQRETLSVLARCVTRELELRTALRREEALRDEMDHRVKNSLQSVASMVRLYERTARTMADPAEAWAAVRRQIIAVSNVHRSIYEAHGEGEIELGSFLERMGTELAASMPPGIMLEMEAAPHRVAPPVAHLFGLAINEFAANAVKHGFAPNASGRISIKTSVENGELVLNCRDTGDQGAKPAASQSGDPPPPSSTGIGRKLIEAGAHGVGARLESGPHPGGGYRMRISLPAQS